MARKTKVYKSLPPQELNQWMEEGRPMVLVDPMPEEQFARRRISGAVNVCVFEVAFLDKMRRLVTDKRRPVVVYGDCWDTFEAAAAAEKLVRDGYREVYTLEGGACGWDEAGFSVEPEGAQDRQGLLDSADQFAVPHDAYIVDPDRCRIRWTGRNANGSHTGTVDVVSGQLAYKRGYFAGSFEIGMGTIANDDVADADLRRVLVAHLTSDDFFFVDSFPRATLTVQSARRIKKATPGAANYDVRGRLSLRGTAAEVRFPAVVSILEDGDVAAEAHFDIDRTRWGVIYGSGKFFRYLGRHLVYDGISLDVRVVAARGRSGE